MSEFVLKTAYTCAKNRGWKIHVTSTSGNTYLVQWKFNFSGDVPYIWECSCPSFKFGRKGTCKHIESVRDQRCAWNESMEPDAQPSEANGLKVCPKCNGPTMAFQVSV